MLVAKWNLLYHSSEDSWNDFIYQEENVGGKAKLVIDRIPKIPGRRWLPRKEGSEIKGVTQLSRK